MLDPKNVPDVLDDELLARYVVSKSHVRGNNTLRPDAFFPHPHRDLSVTRKRDATEDELWLVGLSVALQRNKTLLGRGDVVASVYINEKLRVVKKPIIPKNPNHADVSDWPSKKPAQKLIAQRISAEATYIVSPADLTAQ